MVSRRAKTGGQDDADVAKEAQNKIEKKKGNGYESSGMSEKRPIRSRWD